MLMEKERQQIVEYGKMLITRGLTKGTSGNISIYDPAAGYMAISPSGIGYFDTLPEDVVIMDLEGNIIEGTRKPSSEHGLHSVFYRNKKDICAVVHTHSTFCTTFACLGEPIKAVHYVIAGAAVDEVPCAPYVTFGTPGLAESAIKACGEGRAVLLANHGMVACGVNIAKAFSLAENLEYVAELQWRTRCIGEPRILNETEMKDVRARMATYGQVKK